MIKRISQKIEQVRLEPEHVRLRYVWGSVIVSMFFIFAIWIFSITTLFKSKTDSRGKSSVDSSLSTQLQNIQQQAPSLKDFTETSLNIGNEGVVSNEINSSSTPNNSQNNTDQIPQADAYSELGNPTSNQ